MIIHRLIQWPIKSVVIGSVTLSPCFTALSVTLPGFTVRDLTVFCHRLDPHSPYFSVLLGFVWLYSCLQRFVWGLPCLISGLVKTVSFVVFLVLMVFWWWFAMFVQWCPSKPGFDGPGVEAAGSRPGSPSSWSCGVRGQRRRRLVSDQVWGDQEVWPGGCPETGHRAPQLFLWGWGWC